MKVRFENIDMPLYDGSIRLKLNNVQLNHVNARIDAETECITLSQENIEQSPVSAGKPLSEYSQGDVVQIAGYNFIVLDHDEDGTLVISEDILSNRSFDSVQNDWSCSDLRAWLGGTSWFRTIKNQSGIEVMFLKRDLTSLDGLHDYEYSIDTVSLLTFDEYRKYRSILGVLSDLWWLVTPWSTSTNGFDRSVCCIRHNGVCDTVACNGHLGVRPVLRIKSSCRVQQIVKPKEENKHE